jgi:pimeloyl-ACP methyl ester carboxylesterase
MDSRDQGRSADSPDKLTYEKMTDDLAALLDHLKAGPVNVLGWSDGGIEATAVKVIAESDSLFVCDMPR